MRAEIGRRLREARSIAVVSHLDPDGDAIGTALGLAWILSPGREVYVGLPGGSPRAYAFLPGADGIAAQESELPGPFDVVVAVDATSPSRLGSLEVVLSRGACVLDVDHHGDNTRFGDAAWVDPAACATALLVKELADSEGWRIGAEAAASLYVGILTDTGRFTFANTDARGLAAAAELVRLGAHPADLAGRVYERRTAASMRLLARALESLELHDGGRVACVHVTQAMLLETGASPEDSDGFSNWARSIEGVVVGIFLREAEDGTVKVSFRSNGGVAVDVLAGRFGGGGHPGAAGARVPGPLEKAKGAVLRAVSEHLAHPV